MTKLSREDVYIGLFLYLVFGFMLGYIISARRGGNCNVETEKNVEIVEYIEIDDVVKNTYVDQGVIYTDYELTSDHCHKRTDIKIGDTVWFPFLGNWTFNSPVDFIIVDGVKVGYEKQIVTEIQHDIVDGKDCITSINGYGIHPQKTRGEMLDMIEDYLESEYLY